MGQETIKLTTAQAIVKWLSNQFINIDGKEYNLCGGGFGIFGHGNVTCLGEALYSEQDVLPLYRGQNEQSMGLLLQDIPNNGYDSDLCFVQQVQVLELQTC